MSFRYKFSIVLVILGFIAMIMSLGGRNSGSVQPEDILMKLMSGEYRITADELALMIVEEDSTLQLVDLRNPLSYRRSSIPGAVNIPFPTLLVPGSEKWFKNKVVKTVFYASDELISTKAWMLAMQKGYQGLYLLKGGLKEWNNVVMESEFTGDKITARENALFEKRYMARRLFKQWNEMPDSLKAGFFAAKQMKEKELVGGCE